MTTLMNRNRTPGLKICTVGLALAWWATGCQLYYGEYVADDPDPAQSGEGSTGGAPTPAPTAPTPAPELPVGDPCTSLPDLSVVLDCSVSVEVATYVADEIGGVALHVIGVRRAEEVTAGQPGQAYLEFDLPGSHVVALSAYEATHWLVDVAPGSNLDRIVLFGYHEQTVTAPEGVVVDSFVAETVPAVCGYALDNDGRDCDPQLLLREAEAVAGLPVSTYHGCIRASEFRLQREAAPVCER